MIPLILLKNRGSKGEFGLWISVVLRLLLLFWMIYLFIFDDPLGVTR